MKRKLQSIIIVLSLFLGMLSIVKESKAIDHIDILGLPFALSNGAEFDIRAHQDAVDEITDYYIITVKVPSSNKSNSIVLKKKPKRCKCTYKKSYSDGKLVYEFKLVPQDGCKGTLKITTKVNGQSASYSTSVKKKYPRATICWLDGAEAHTRDDVWVGKAHRNSKESYQILCADVAKVTAKVVSNTNKKVTGKLVIKQKKKNDQVTLTISHKTGTVAGTAQIGLQVTAKDLNGITTKKNLYIRLSVD